MDGPNGPASGRLLNIGRLLAARNGVALDSVMTMMAGRRPDYVPTLRIAGERGLGPIEPDDIEVSGDFEVISGFRMPSAEMGRFTGSVGGVYRLLTRNPCVLRRNCTRCRMCAEKCPVQAIELNPCPTIDRTRCIRCFCCVEVCPERAMLIPSLRRTIWRNLLGR
jgi:ferredoxin